MDRKTVTSILLCFLIYFFWNEYYLKPRIPKKPTQQVTEQTINNNNLDSSTSIQNKSGQPAGKQNRADTQGTPGIITGKIEKGRGQTKPAKDLQPVEKRTMSLLNSEVTFQSKGPLIADWKSTEYNVSLKEDSLPVDLYVVARESRQLQLAFDHPDLAYLADVRGTFGGSVESVLKWTYSDENISITKTITPTEERDFLLVNHQVEFKKTQPRYAFIMIDGRSREKDDEVIDRGFQFYTGEEDLETFLMNDLPDKAAGLDTSINWMTAQNRYFTIAVANEETKAIQGLVQPMGEYAARASMVYPVKSETFDLPVKVYFGPKTLDRLRAVDPSLEETVDLGFASALAYPLLWLLKWFYQYVHNWGWAIIFMTLTVRLITFPLNYKSMKAMKKNAKVMEKLKPQMDALKVRYKDDPKMMNTEMMAMWRKNGHNPLAGCLPMLIQMPVFIAFYRVLYSAVELYQAPFGLWIHDLSAADPYYIIPVLVTASFWFQQKITPQAASMDPTQQKVMQFMPLMFGAFMLTMPSGLNVYFFVSTAFGICQQQLLYRKMDREADSGNDFRKKSGKKPKKKKKTNVVSIQSQ